MLVTVHRLWVTVNRHKKIQHAIDLELEHEQAQGVGDIARMDQIDAELRELGRHIKRPMV